MKIAFCRAAILALVLLSWSAGTAITLREATVPDLKVPAPTSLYLLDWVALGPFPIEPAVKGQPIPKSWSEQDHINVTSLRVFAGEFEGKRWQPIKNDPDAKFRLQDKFSPNENVAIYLGTYVFAEKACQRNLLFGSDDGVTIWVNGERVFDKQTNRECKQDQDIASVKLVQGMNVLVARVTQGAGGWEFVARFDDNTGLSTSTRPFASRAKKLSNSETTASRNPQLLAGPYIQNVTTTSARIMWYTNDLSLGQVTVSDGTVSQSYTTKLTRRVHEIIVEDLTPNKEYTYTLAFVDAEGNMIRQIANADLRFKTFPDKGDVIKFIAYGDTRTNPERHAEVINAMAHEEDIAFVLMTGDLVGHGADLHLWPKEFFTPASKLMCRVPFFTTLGNHEVNAQYYFDLLSLPGDERFYSFDYLDAHIISLDSCTTFAPGHAPYEWLVADLEKHKDAKWKFIFMHHPTYTSSSHGALGSDGKPKETPIRVAQDIFPDLAKKYGITAIFSGHDHTYERSLRDGVHYIVTGGGGAPTYGESNPKQNPYRQYFYPGCHYCVITIQGDKGSIVTKLPNGKVIDSLDF